MKLRKFENSGKFRIVFKEISGEIQPYVFLDIDYKKENYLEIKIQINETLLVLTGGICCTSGIIDDLDLLGEHTKQINLGLESYNALSQIIELFKTSGFDYVN